MRARSDTSEPARRAPPLLTTVCYILGDRTIGRDILVFRECASLLFLAPPTSRFAREESDDITIVYWHRAGASRRRFIFIVDRTAPGARRRLRELPASDRAVDH